MVILKKRKSAFTLIEMLLVVAIITISSAIFAPMISEMFFANNLESANENIKTNLRRAQVLSRTSTNDSDWGVILESGKLTLFSGSSFLSRDTSFDEILEFATNIALSGDMEIIFIKNEGAPITNKAINLELRNKTTSIYLNTKGLIY